MKITINLNDITSEEMQKLAAWQRLKDKGFEFRGWSVPADGHARIMIEGTCVPNIVKELNILFGEEG